MNAFEKLSLDQIVWYTLPGAMFLFVVLFPVSIMYPNKIAYLFDNVGILGLFFIAIILGFLLDGLRLYRLRPQYMKIRSSFFDELKTALESEQNPYYLLEYLHKLLNETHYNTLRFYHSIWIMLGQVSTSIIFSSLLLWPFFMFNVTFLNGNCALFGEEVLKSHYVLFCFFSLSLSVTIGFRIMIISIEEQKKCNKMYIEFAKSNKDQIKEALTNGYTR
jgi:hypothetical protein